MKCNYIVNGEYKEPTYEEYEEIKMGDIFQKQMELLEKEGKVSVLNTSVFFVIDFLQNDRLYKKIFQK